MAGKLVRIPANNALPAATAIPDAQKTLTLTGGAYDVWVRFKAPYNGHDTFYFAVDTLGYSQIALDGTSAFPYNPLVPVTQLTYNKTLASPNNGYAYREWVWRKVASNYSLAAGDHTLKVSNRNSSGGANPPSIDSSSCPPEVRRPRSQTNTSRQRSCGRGTPATIPPGAPATTAATAWPQRINWSA